MSFFVPGGLGFTRQPLFDARNVPGYIAYFEASNATNDGSGLCSQWDEFYGNGMSFSQSTQSKRPTIITDSATGLPALQGNPASSVNMSGNAAFLAATKNLSGLTIYAIARQKSTGTSVLFTASINGSGSTRVFLGDVSRAYLSGGRRLDADSAVNIPSSGIYGDIPNILPLTAVIDYAGAKGYLYRNNVLIGKTDPFQTAGSTSNTNSANVNLFSLAGGSSGYFDGELLGLLLCSQAHTSQIQATTWQQWKSKLALNPLLPTLSDSPEMIVQLHGDSITHGNALTYGNKTLSDRTWEQLGYSDSKIVVNLGKTGATVSTLSSDRAGFVDVLPLATAGKVIYCVFVGTNDIAAGTAGATVYGSIKTLFQAAQSARSGVKVIVCTPIARGGSLTSGQRTELVALRSAINTNAVADGANAVCDFGGLAPFLTSSTSVYSDTTYYNNDQIHPTDFGNQVKGAELARVINTI